MEKALHFALVGGDQRQVWLGTHLAADGHRVTTLAMPGAAGTPEELGSADVVLLPMPVTDGTGALFAPLTEGELSLQDCLNNLTPGQIIFAGRVDAGIRGQAARRGLVIHDYFAREELTIANAVPTAEGAVQLAMEQLPITIHRSRVLITGFGRVGQCTAQRFAALGADVTAAARSPAQLALAEALGCTPLALSRLAECPPQDLAINTVPHILFGREQLAPLGSCVLMELASPPGGFDPEAVRQLGLHLIPAPGLPGRVAPATAARAIQRTIYTMLAEFDF